METHVFVTLAQIRILLVPVGAISRSDFEKCAADIRSFDEIRLADVPVDSNSDRARFMPNSQSKGTLHISFPSHPTPSSHSPLSLFRPSHFPLAVIGVSTCSQTDSLKDILDQFHSTLVDMAPNASMYPLAHKLFVFESNDESTNLNLGDTLPGLVVIPSMMGNKKLYIGTLLADLCSTILGDFAQVAQTLESPLGNEYLNGSLLPLLPPEHEMPKSLDSRDSLPALPSRNSQPELASAKLAGIGIQRTVSTGPQQIHRQSTLGIPPMSKRRQSGIGVASSHGRLYKVLADFFLLAGRLEDATVWYAEAMALFKTQPDTIWHASALEGLATITVLEAWAMGQHGSMPPNGRDPWAEPAEKLTQAISLYYKATPGTEAEAQYGLVSLLYSSAVLRQASLFFAVWSAKGWGPLAFTTMMQPGSTPSLPPTLSTDNGQTSWLYLERMSIATGISRSQIASIVAQAHGPWLLHLGAGERISVLEAMSSLYACLGYRRKEAYILREVLGCIMDMLVCGREEEGPSYRTPVTGGLGISGFSMSMGNASPAGARGDIGVRMRENTEGNESILRLLRYVCKVLGINLGSVQLVNPEEGSNPAAGDEEAETDNNPEPYGWPELQVGVVREAVAVAEALPDYPAVAQFALSSLKTMHSVLAAGDQYYLYTTSGRALTTARRRGNTQQVEYWSGRPVVSIALSPLPFVRLPIEKPMSVLSTRLSGVNPILAGAKDPFLYNPRKSITGHGKTLIVQNEPLELAVTLRNPYVFDIEIASLTLSTVGVRFEAKPLAVTIPANSFHSVTIIGKPLETGDLVIRGCNAQAPGGVAQEFILPISSDEEEERRSRKRSAVECEIGRSKYAGLDSRPWEKADKRLSAQINQTTPAPPPKRVFQFMECNVVPEQPLLRIRRTSLTHGAVMLYDGEMSIIRMTLENVGTLPIDFLRLSFDDSTIEPAQQALTDGDLSVFDTYETEYDLIHRPMFSWSSPKDSKEVAPGQKATLTVKCFGKVGCTNGTVHISYSYIHRPQLTLTERPKDVFHTRQLSYPVLVTVYHMLECDGMDVIPFSGVDSSDEDGHIGTPDGNRIANLDVGSEEGWCIFSIEVRNTYGLPFEVTFERDQMDIPQAETSSVVPPGSTTRILLPVKKFLIPEDKVTKAVPTLSERQFVVTKSKLSSAEEIAQRELFWYREELLKSIRGRWREVGGTRSGDLSLRKQRLTLPMLECLRTETARANMYLVRYDDDGEAQEIPKRGGKSLPSPNEFVYLRTLVTNLSPLPVVLTLDLGIEPSEHLVSEGVLADISVGRLDPGESREVETAVCFLSYGRFEVAAELRIMGSGPHTHRAGRGWLKAVVREETA